MIVGGEIIAISNKDKKTFILFPRGTPYYSQLSGTITASRGQQNIMTTENLTSEVRRGEAIKVGPYWYRLSCAVGSGSEREQTQRSTAPLSVTLDKEMSESNVYCSPFNANTLPLDGDFDNGQNNGSAFKGVALKHGCTNDIKDIWRKTYEKTKSFVTDDTLLRQELVKHGLMRQLNASLDRKKKPEKKEKEKKKRQIRKPRDSQRDNNNLGINAHLRGTAVEKILMETRQKINNQG
jgi:hypothetical protein